VYKEFDIPKFLAGPCSIIGFVTGTDTPEFSGSFQFAHIPASWVTVA